MRQSTTSIIVNDLSEKFLLFDETNSTCHNMKNKMYNTVITVP